MKNGKSTPTFSWIFLAFLLGSGIAGLACQARSQIGPAPSHHVEGGFKNPHLESRKRLGDFFRWRFGLGPKEIPALPPESVPPFQSEMIPPDLNSLNHADPQTIQVTWIGHSTFLIQVAGLNILTDPIFSDRASPISLAGPRRVTPPALRLEELPPIHVVLVSHNHYDHLDKATVRKLGPAAKFFVPLKLADWFQETGLNNVTEMDWWQTAEFGPIRLHCVPAQHFSIRTPFNANTTLWAGWVLETPAGKIYFAGDTGYSPDFAQIGQRLGPMRLALIPIGGYSPRWFMRPMHVNPEEAVQVHQDVNSQQSIGMHWGTFRLTEEPLGEPPLFLEKVLREKNMSPESFIVLKFGETRILPPLAPVPGSGSADRGERPRGSFTPLTGTPYMPPISAGARPAGEPACLQR